MFRGAIIVEFSSVSVKYLPAANAVMLCLNNEDFAKTHHATGQTLPKVFFHISSSPFHVGT